MEEEITAKKFYEEIEKKKELSKFKLVNGLFIVRYTNNEECVYIGDFLKSESALNQGKKNLILIKDKAEGDYYPQRFNKKLKIATTSLGFWRTLNIKFIEKPIKEILK